MRTDTGRVKSLIRPVVFLSALAAATAVFGSQEPRPLVLGPLASTLTPTDLTEIQALESVARGWLIIAGSNGPVVNGLGLNVSMFLMPDSNGDRLRRGPMLFVSLARMRDGTQPPWKTVATGRWAQVRPVDRDWTIASERDPQRPFVLHGEMSDEDVVSLVDFIRTQPRMELGGRTCGPDSGRVPGVWPIITVAKRPNQSFAVHLAEPRSQNSGCEAILTQVGQNWTVTQATVWLGRL